MTLTALLLIDAGNSALKWQLVCRSETDLSLAQHALDAVMQSPIHRVDNADVSVEGLISAWRQAAEQTASDAVGPAQWQMAWCSVGPVSVQQAVAQAYKRLTGQEASPLCRSAAEVRLSGVGCETVENRYANPGQLGVDRWVSAIGLAAQGVTGPHETHMIVSAGTATTVDLLRHESAPDESDCMRLSFLGGWIIPGIRLMNNVLRTETRDLDYAVAQDDLAPTEIPRDSQTAITQGIGLAQTGFVAGLIRHHRVTKLWLHGGQAQDWRYFLAALDQVSGPMVTVHEQPTLIFSGLLTLARFQRSAVDRR
jgi:type III pantothenate kinase